MPAALSTALARCRSSAISLVQDASAPKSMILNCASGGWQAMLKSAAMSSCCGTGRGRAGSCTNKAASVQHASQSWPAAAHLYLRAQRQP